MTTYDVLTQYSALTAVRVAALAFLILGLCALTLPLALFTMLLDRAVTGLSTVVFRAPQQNAGGRAYPSSTRGGAR